jgi:hypothetical protein
LPHSPQNFIAGGFSKPQLEHLDLSDEPHSPQNFIPLAFSNPQEGQTIGDPSRIAMMHRFAFCENATQALLRL